MRLADVQREMDSLLVIRVDLDLDLHMYRRSRSTSNSEVRSIYTGAALSIITNKKDEVSAAVNHLDSIDLALKMTFR